MADPTMIRKQLYITPEQDRALKDRARAEGLTEAEIVREALDRHLKHDNGPFVPGDRRHLIDVMIEGNRRLAKNLRFPKGYAQIWAAARLNQVPFVVSEYFNVGATLDGVILAIHSIRRSTLAGCNPVSA